MKLLSSSIFYFKILILIASCSNFIHSSYSNNYFKALSSLAFLHPHQKDTDHQRQRRKRLFFFFGDNEQEKKQKKQHQHNHQPHHRQTQQQPKHQSNHSNNLRKLFTYSPIFWKNVTVSNTSVADSTDTTSHTVITPAEAENFHTHHYSLTTLNELDAEIHQEKPKEKKKQYITLLTYTHPETNISYHASNTPKSKFISYITYQLNLSPKYIPEESIREDEVELSTTAIKNDNLTTSRDYLRTIWKEGRLLTNSTEILAYYASDQKSNSSTKSNTKRGSFLDYCNMYMERFISIIQDSDSSNALYYFLISEYGLENLEKLKPSNFYQSSVDNQLAILQHFLTWFRSKFPYYYDRCDHCGKSVKEESSNFQESSSSSPFLGYIYPSHMEATKGKASRTELYHCPYCHTYTRFPRYNHAHEIIQHDKGRCGEYSLLLFQFFKCLGFETIKWVVDWSDHVWVEMEVSPDRNIHLDPCEAVVDHKLLYQEWGKKQTFIVAFSLNGVIEDVTRCYTTDKEEEIKERREGEDVEAVVKELQDVLRKRLKEVL